MVNGILLPTVNLLSDPDFINQTISWPVSLYSFNLFMSTDETSVICVQFSLVLLSVIVIMNLFWFSFSFQNFLVFCLRFRISGSS